MKLSIFSNVKRVAVGSICGDPRSRRALAASGVRSSAVSQLQPPAPGLSASIHARQVCGHHGAALGLMRSGQGSHERGRHLRRPLFNASLFSNPRLLRWRSERPANAVGPPAFESRGSLISVVSFGAPTRLYRRDVGCTHRRFHIGLIKKNFSRTARCRRFHKREVRFFRPVWSSLTSFRCCSIISAIRRRGANRRSAA